MCIRDRAVGAIREQISIPLVVDIHFDYRLALEAVAAGADKVRINPGNIGAPERVKAVAQACRVRGVPIRIGVNGGSLEDVYKRQVQALREMTGVGMMDCKKALTEADGNMDKAVEILREKGLAASQKKAGRIAAEGMAYAAVVDVYKRQLGPREMMRGSGWIR